MGPVDPIQRDLFIVGAAFVFGAAIGSFLNVVIYRLPRADEGLFLTKPRLSICPQCGATIRWYDNIPLLSYFLLGAKCRSCRAPIPLRYFAVELLTACLFALTAHRLATGPEPDFAHAAVVAAFLASLVAVTFIDIDLRIIPDKIDIPGMALAPVLAFLVPALHRGSGDLETLASLVNRVAALFGTSGDLVPKAFGLSGHERVAAAIASLIGIATGAGVIWLVGRAGKALFKKEAMGFGDVKLLGMMGGYVGWKGVFLILLLASVCGALIGIIVKLATRESYIPFGPFLSLGAAIVVLWRAEVLHVIFVSYPNLFR